MCTAVSYKAGEHYFGRNLDLERGYGERVVITPRNYNFSFRHTEPSSHRYAMIGMAAVVDGYPLYFDATNEKGLSMAGLNFPDNACYPEYDPKRCNVAPFELIPYLLTSCASVDEAEDLLGRINVVNTDFSEGLPTTPLHWIISDAERSITLECTRGGTNIYENPFGVLTNNPPFEYHLANINNYMGLCEGFVENRLSKNIRLNNYSLGMGALGLPGDFSSASRFVKAVFVKEKSQFGKSEKECVNQFFHILRSVEMPKGCVVAKNGEYEYTRYSSCCNTDTQTYHFTTYENSTVRSVSLHDCDIDGNELCEFPIE